jgi:8-oxo-dGTP pyrophosphatase MutT (NUDIX family)
VPAATAALLREGTGPGEPGIEVLLLRRAGTSGFVPNAYVFPGGRLDASDSNPALLGRLSGITPDELDRRFGLSGEVPRATAYLMAAVRETFEETGLLPGLPEARVGDPALERLRSDLLEGASSLATVLEEIGLGVEWTKAAYVAHWVTPESEPRRYDTRFFVIHLPGSAPITVRRREIAEARWLAPAEALALHERGELPMVFPTVKTLEDLASFATVREAIDQFRKREVPRILPRLVRTASGVGIEIPDLRESPPESQP